MNDIQKVLGLVLKRIQWAREEGETDLRSLRFYVECLSKEAETLTSDEMLAKSAAKDAEIDD